MGFVETGCQRFDSFSSAYIVAGFFSIASAYNIYKIGWGNYEISVSHKERITIKTEKYNSKAYEIEHEAFEDSDDRIIAYDHWR